MANLGTLLFGADIDLKQLKANIEAAKGDIEKALKMTFKPEIVVDNTTLNSISEAFKSTSESAKKSSQERVEAENKVVEAKVKSNKESENEVAAAQRIAQIKVEILALEEKITAKELERLSLQKAIDSGTGNQDAFKGRLAQVNKDIAGYKEQIKTLKEEESQYSATIAKNTAEKNKDAQATTHLSEAEQKLASSIKSSSDSMRGQSQVLRDLKTMATQYLSIWGAQSFVNSIIQTGGLLEQQRMSIGAILGDLSQANHLFGQITQLALKSPFGVVQLDTMSKQLTAYNFKYSELYDWTKRLADISAATGTEVSRLALALGHVRSEGALSGYTLRQFAMGNVPLLQTLSQQLGKTTSEIRKMTREKAITYDDVEKALKTLTDEGGIFANAQEVMSNALNAKFKNLHDAFDIMFGNMAESSVGDVLKKVAETLTVLAKHWRETGAVLLTVAGALGVYKAGMAIANKTMVESNALAGRYSAAQLEMQARTGALSKEMLLQAVALKKVTVAEAEAAGAAYNLTTAQLKAVATTGRVNAAYNAGTISTSKYTMAQLRLMAAFRGASWASFTKYLTGMQLALGGLANAARVAGVALKGIFLNPATWWMVAITAGVEAWMHFSQKADEAKERVKDLMKTANEGFKSLEKESENFKIGASMGMDKKQLQESITQMEEILKSYSTQSGNILSEAFKIDPSTGKSVYNLQERYEMLAKAVEETKESYVELGKVGDILEQSNDETDGWFDESFRENTEDYIDALKDRNKAENDFIAFHRNEIIQALNNTRGAFAEYDNEIRKNVDLYKATEGREGFAEGDLKAQLDLLRDNFQYFERFDGEIRKTSEAAFDSWANFNTEFRKTSESFGVMDADLQKFASTIKKRFEGVFGETADKWTNAQKMAVQKSVELFMTGINGYSDMADAQRKEIESKLLAPMYIPIDADTREANRALTEMREYLNELVGKEWVIKLHLETVGSFEQLYDQLDKTVKKSNETIKKLGDGFSEKDKARITSMATDINTLTDKEKEYRDAVLNRQEAIKAANKEGFKLSSLEKAANKAATAAHKAETAAEKRAKARTKMAEAQLKIDDELAKQRLELEDAIADAEVAAIENNAERERAQRELEFKKQKRQLDKQVEEWKKKSFELAKKEYEANPKNKTVSFYDTPVGKAGWQAQALTDDQWMTYIAGLKKYNEERQRYEKELYESQMKNMRDYLKEYGSFEERRKAITEEYNQKLKDVDKENLAERLKLDREYEDQISKLSMEVFKEGINWEDVFGDLESYSTEYLKKLRDQLKEALNNKEIQPKDAEVLGTQLDKIGSLISQRSHEWASNFGLISPELEKIIRNEQEVAAAQEEVARAEERYAQALAEVADAKKKIASIANQNGLDLSDQEISTNNFQNIINIFKGTGKDTKSLTDAFSKLAGAENKLNTSTQSLNQAQGKLTTAQAKGGNSMASTIAVIDTIIHAINDGVQELTETLKLLNLEKTRFGKGWEKFAESSSYATKGWESLKSGNIGGVINGVIGSIVTLKEAIGQWLSPDNHEEQLEIQDKLNRSIESTTKALDAMTAELEKSYGIMAIQNKAAAEELIKKNMESIMKGIDSVLNDNYGGGHSEYWHLNKNKSLLAQISGYGAQFGISANTWQDILKNDANDVAQLFKYIQEHDAELWRQITQESGYNEGALEEWIQKLIDTYDQLAENDKKLREQLTTTTEDNVFEEFRNSLYELADGSEDVTKDIAENWQKMINRMIINNLVFGENFQKELSKWYEDLYAANERLSETGNEKAYQDDIAALGQRYTDMIDKANGEIQRLTEMGIIKPIEESTSSAESAFKDLRSSFLDTLMDMEGDAKDFRKKMEEIMVKDLIEKNVFSKAFTIGDEAYKNLDEYITKWNERYADAVAKNDTVLIDQLLDELVKVRELTIKEAETLRDRLKEIGDEAGEEDDTTFSGLSDSWVSTLMDMSKTAEDWAEDIGRTMAEKIIKEMVVPTMLQPLLDDLQAVFDNTMEKAVKTDEEGNKHYDWDAIFGSEDLTKAIKVLTDAYPEAQELVKKIMDIFGLDTYKHEGFSNLSDSIIDSLKSVDGSVEDWSKEQGKKMAEQMAQAYVDEIYGSKISELNEAWQNALDKGDVNAMKVIERDLETLYQKMAGDPRLQEFIAKFKELADNPFKDMAKEFTQSLMDMEQTTEDFGLTIARNLTEQMLDKIIGDSYQAQIDALGNQWAEALKNGDTAAIERIKQDMMALRDQMGEAVQPLLDAIKEIDEQTDTTFKDMTDSWVSALMDMDKTAEDWAQEVGKMMAQKIITEMVAPIYIQPLLDAMQEAFNDAMAVEGATFKSVMSGMTPFIEDIKEKFDEIRPIIEEIFGGFGIVTEAVEEVEEAVDEVEYALGDLKSEFSSALMDMESTAESFSKNIKNILAKTFVEKFILGDRFDAMMEQWQQQFEGILTGSMSYDQRKKSIQQLADAMTDYEQSLVGPVWDLLESLGLTASSEQEATMNMSDKITYDQADQLLGINLAQELTLEQILAEIRGRGITPDVVSSVPKVYRQAAESVNYENEQNRDVVNALLSVIDVTRMGSESILTQLAMANSSLSMIRDYSKKIRDEVVLHLASMDTKLNGLNRL